MRPGDRADGARVVRGDDRAARGFHPSARWAEGQRVVRGERPRQRPESGGQVCGARSEHSRPGDAAIDRDVREAGRGRSFDDDLLAGAGEHARPARHARARPHANVAAGDGDDAPVVAPERERQAHHLDGRVVVRAARE